MKSSSIHSVFFPHKSMFLLIYLPLNFILQHQALLYKWCAGMYICKWCGIFSSAGLKFWIMPLQYSRHNIVSKIEGCLNLWWGLRLWRITIVVILVRNQFKRVEWCMAPYMYDLLWWFTNKCLVWKGYCYIL